MNTLQRESIPQLMMNETTAEFMPAKIKKNFNTHEAKKGFFAKTNSSEMKERKSSRRRSANPMIRSEFSTIFHELKLLLVRVIPQDVGRGHS